MLDPRSLARLDGLRTRTRLRSTGPHPGDRRSARRGAGQEFVDYRPYTQGDELRQVDWNLYARSDRLMVKQFAEERDLCVHLLVDTSASMGFGSPTKLACASHAAAMLGYIALSSRERVALGLLRPGRLQRLSPRRGRRYSVSLMRQLDALDAAGSTSLSQALRQYASASAPGVAIVISDFLVERSDYEAGLGALLARGFDVQVVHVLSHDELEPPFDGDLRVRDVEGAGATTPSTTDALDVSFEAASRAAYTANVAAFREDVRQFCVRRGVPWLGIIDTRIDGNELLRQLLQRGFIAGSGASGHGASGRAGGSSAIGSSSSAT